MIHREAVTVLERIFPESMPDHFEVCAKKDSIILIVTCGDKWNHLVVFEVLEFVIVNRGVGGNLILHSANDLVFLFAAVINNRSTTGVAFVDEAIIPFSTDQANLDLVF